MITGLILANVGGAAVGASVDSLGQALVLAGAWGFVSSVMCQVVGFP